MNCQETQRWLHAYCDGELDLPHSLELEQHLRDCPACAAARDAVKVGSGQIRKAAFATPAHLQRRIRAAVLPAEERRTKSAHRPFRSWFGWALSAAAASLVLALVLAQTVFHPGAESTVNEITDSHIRSLMGNRLVDVASSDQHTVRPWFEGKVDFAPAVPDLSAQGFEIIGGRLDYISGHPAATLVYQSRKHYVSLFIWPSDAKDAATSSASFKDEPSRRGYQVIHWTSNGMDHWAVSEIMPDQLRHFAKAFASEEAGR